MVVDTDAVLTGAVALEGLETIARKHTKVLAFRGFRNVLGRQSAFPAGAVDG